MLIEFLPALAPQVCQRATLHLRDVLPDVRRRVRRVEERFRGKRFRRRSENRICRKIDKIGLQSAQQDQVKEFSNCGGPQMTSLLRSLYDGHNTYNSIIGLAIKNSNYGGKEGQSVSKIVHIIIVRHIRNNFVKKHISQFDLRDFIEPVA